MPISFIYRSVLLVALSVSTGSTIMQYLSHIPGTETCPGFTIEAPPKTTPVYSPLYTAATAGNLEQVEELLRKSDSVCNVYESDDTDESLLSRVMRNKHELVAHRLMDEYEKDLNIIADYFAKNNISSNKWLRQRILISLGIEQATQVRGHITHGMNINRSEPIDNPQGLIILLKQLEGNKTEVLWLNAIQSGDDRAIARIVDLIYRNGMIDVEQQMHDNRSLLDVAAKNGLVELFFRLDRIFGESLGWSGVKYMSLLCQLANKSGDRIASINSMIKLATRLDVNAVYLHEDAWRMLEIPIKLDQLDVFDYILNNIEKESKRSTTQILDDLVRNSIYFSMDAQRGKYHTDLTRITPYFWKHKVNLLTINQSSTYKWTPLLLVLCQSTPKELTHYLNENLHLISKDTNLLGHIVMGLLRDNQLQVLREWNYLSIPDFPHRLKYELNQAMNSINDLDMINYLMEVCYDDYTENSIKYKVWVFSETPNSATVLRKLLVHPKSLDITKMRLNDQVWTPMARSLVSHCPENYHAMYESAKSKEEIANVIENGGLNLLAAAIWNRLPVCTEYDSDYGDPFPFDFEDNSLDSINSAKENQPQDSKADEEQRLIYNNIFLELLKLGADPHIISKYDENLIHVAVKCDNVWALQELLKQGVDPNRVAAGGIRPIHLVKSVQMLNELMSILPDNIMTVTDDRGYTPLSVYCTSSRLDTKDEQLMDTMLRLGGSVADTNIHDHNTPLHHVRDDWKLAKWLLKNGGSVNAQNKNGFTPFHEASTQILRFEVMKELINVPTLDLNVLTNAGVSYLAALVQLSESQFSEIRTVIERRQTEFNRLFEEQCNSKDDRDSPIIYTAIRSDTNDYCLQKLLACKNLNKDGLAFSTIGEPVRLRRVIEEEGAIVKPCQGSSSLTYAIGNKSVGMKSYPESLRILLANGVSAVLNDTHGQKPLHSVFHFGSGPKAIVECAAALIGAGADYRSKDVVENVRQTVLVCLLVNEMH